MSIMRNVVLLLFAALALACAPQKETGEGVKLSEREAYRYARALEEL